MKKINTLTVRLKTTCSGEAEFSYSTSSETLRAVQYGMLNDY